VQKSDKAFPMFCAAHENETCECLARQKTSYGMNLCCLRTFFNAHWNAFATLSVPLLAARREACYDLRPSLARLQVLVLNWHRTSRYSAIRRHNS
jgi:hypothetical protein